MQTIWFRMPDGSFFLENSDLFLCPYCSMLEYSLDLQNVSFSAVRTVRVLRPLRAINRVPSKLNPFSPFFLCPVLAHYFWQSGTRRISLISFPKFHIMSSPTSTDHADCYCVISWCSAYCLHVLFNEWSIHLSHLLKKARIVSQTDRWRLAILFPNAFDFWCAACLAEQYC